MILQPLVRNAHVMLMVIPNGCVNNPDLECLAQYRSHGVLSFGHSYPVEEDNRSLSGYLLANTEPAITGEYLLYRRITEFGDKNI